MSIPAILILVLYGLALLVSANQHGKPKTGVESFWSAAIGVGLQVGLLWWGGFFS